MRNGLSEVDVYNGTSKREGF